MKTKYDVIVIGGGPAGLASALSAKENGAQSVCIIERDKELGGILNQCIHNGFGLHHFKEELTGPEYAGKYIDRVKETDIEVLLDTMVLEITPDKKVYTSSKEKGVVVYQAKALILNMGCRERTRGAIGIAGDRVAGVLTAGSAQRYVNIEGYMPGKKVIILGSGDIGLIMARRMTLEGAKVVACVELMPYSNGLNRNIVQCLQDYNIPLYLSHTITEIKGKDGRVNKVIVSQVDEKKEPIPGSEMEFEVDCVLLSVGLIPENECSVHAGIQIDPHTKGPVVYDNMETSIPGIFAAGNVVHVHDLVDFVSAESQRAGVAAGQYVSLGNPSFSSVIETQAAGLVGYVIPQKIRLPHREKGISLFFRVRQVVKNAVVVVKDKEGVIAQFKKEYMAPGEMQTILLPKEILEKVVADTIYVEVQV